MMERIVACLCGLRSVSMRIVPADLANFLNWTWLLKTWSRFAGWYCVETTFVWTLILRKSSAGGGRREWNYCNCLWQSMTLVMEPFVSNFETQLVQIKLGKRLVLFGSWKAHPSAKNVLNERCCSLTSSHAQSILQSGYDETLPPRVLAAKAKSQEQSGDNLVGICTLQLNNPARTASRLAAIVELQLYFIVRQFHRSARLSQNGI